MACGGVTAAARLLRVPLRELAGAGGGSGEQKLHIAGLALCALFRLAGVQGAAAAMEQHQVGNLNGETFLSFFFSLNRVATDV